MLRDPPPTNAEILPEVSQRSYFFNRIGRLLPFASGGVDQVSLTFDDFQVVKIVLHRGRATDYRKDALYI